MTDSITVYYGENFSVVIHPVEFFNHAYIKNVKTLINYAFNEQKNQDAFENIGRCLMTMVDEANAKWIEHGKDYIDKFVCLQFHYEWTENQKRIARANNEKMKRQLKRDKAQYEKIVKILNYYNKIKGE